MRFALVAAKRLALAKSRLAPHLSDQARSAVSRAMFIDVLENLARARTIDTVAVVTADPDLTTIARESGAAVIEEESPRGLNEAVRLGTLWGVRQGATSALTVLSDLPLLDGRDVDAFYEDLPGTPGVRLVASHEGSGTNALLRSPPEIIPTCFERSRSYEEHLGEARRAGVPVTVLRLPGVERDVDTVDDLRAVVASGRPCHTRRLLTELGFDATGGP